MSEERLQEIKDSISLQYKVQEANDLHNFNIFTDEEQELVDEIERLQKENQILMNSMVTEAHTKETKEIERLNNIIKELNDYCFQRMSELNNIQERDEKLQDFCDNKINAFIEVREKIKDLKGEDKE